MNFWRRWRGLLITLCLALVLTGCCFAFASEPPKTEWTFVNKRVLDPPNKYERWFYDMAFCTATVGVDYESIKWYTVSEMRYSGQDLEDSVLGLANYNDQIIYLLESQVDNKFIVKHEIGHILGYRKGHNILNHCARK
ncbi:MAG: hypothetical protein ACYTAO_04255 [Planctomycetota bacterium]|jgi:hypothetical protein